MMDDVEEFSIDYDITDRECVYDYVTCTEYVRPPTGWDYRVFRGSHSGLDCLDEDDDAGQDRVKLMDNAFKDKKVLESRVKHDQEEDKKAKAARKSKSGDRMDEYTWLENPSRKEENELPRRMLPIYKTGDVIKGCVELTLTKPLKASKLVVGFQGRSYVSVITSNGKQTYQVTGEEIFVKEKLILWEEYGEDSTRAADQFSLLNLDNPVGKVMRSKQIPSGTHKFPFEFVVPSDVPQSCPPVVISSCNKGYLLYRLKAVIDKDNVASRGNIITHRGLWIRRYIDIAQDPSNLEAAVAEENYEPHFTKNKKIEVTATLKHYGCILGESIPIQVEIQNDTNRVIDEVSGYVRVFGKARPKTYKICPTASIDIKGVKWKESGVPAGQHRILNGTLIWDFKHRSVDGSLLPVGDLDDSNLLDIKYEVRIDVKRKGPHRDIHLTIPIFVGSHCSKQIPQ